VRLRWLILFCISLTTFCWSNSDDNSLCTIQSKGTINDQSMSSAVWKKYGLATKLFNPKKGEGFVPPEKIEKGFEALEEYRTYCREHCNKYELFSMYGSFGQLYFNYDRYEDMLKEYKQALNTSIKIPIGFETDILLNLSKTYYIKNDFLKIEPCLSRLNKLGTFYVIDDGYLVAAVKLAKDQPMEALSFVNAIIGRKENSNLVLASKSDYDIKMKILASIGKVPDNHFVEKYNHAIELDNQPKELMEFLSIIPISAENSDKKGACTALFDVLPNGKTDNIRIVKCENKKMEKVVLKSLRRMPFRPNLVDGKPVKSTGVNKTFIFGDI